MRLFIRTDDVLWPLVWTTSRELYFTKIRWQCLWSTRAQVVIWGQHSIEPWRLFRLDFLFRSRHSAVFTLWLGSIMAWLDFTDGDAPTSCEKQLVLVATKNIQDITEAVGYQQEVNYSCGLLKMLAINKIARSRSTRRIKKKKKKKKSA